jgi:hypothetical protein
MVGDADDAIGHTQTDSPHRLTIEALLEAAGGKYHFICIMYMDDPSTDSYTRRSQQIYRAHKVVVAMQDLVFSPS